MSDEQQGQKPPGRLAMTFVGFTGLSAVAIGAVGNFMHEDSGTNIAFVIAGIFAVVIAPILPRVKKFKITPTSGEVETLDDSERQVEQGQVIKADKAVDLVEAAFGGTATQSIEALASGTGMVTESQASDEQRVSLTANAIADLTKLSAAERSIIEADLLQLGETSDPRATEPNSGGKSYFVHRSPGDLRIYYRRLDKTHPNRPDQYVVLKIDKKTSPA